MSIDEIIQAEHRVRRVNDKKYNEKGKQETMTMTGKGQCHGA